MPVRAPRSGHIRGRGRSSSSKDERGFQAAQGSAGSTTGANSTESDVLGSGFRVSLAAKTVIDTTATPAATNIAQTIAVANLTTTNRQNERNLTDVTQLT